MPKLNLIIDRFFFCFNPAINKRSSSVLDCTKDYIHKNEIINIMGKSILIKGSEWAQPSAIVKCSLSIAVYREV